ncbi:MAG: glycosyltransferase [Saprospiraceae bacterium]|nr:glycosyltransferase [Saprospiraceae bacterium]
MATSLLAVLYAAVVAAAVFHWRRLPAASGAAPENPPPSLTVVVAARNEAQRIGACLHSILQNRYPADRLEVLVADDHSTDGTAAIIEGFAQQGVRRLALPEAVSGKKAALAAGIAVARGAWIVCTDADCTVPPAWLRGVAHAVQTRGASALAGPVLLDPAGTLWERFQALDGIGTMVLTGAGFQSGNLLLGNGAHLAFSRIAFENAGGYAFGASYASGDDLFLLHRIARSHPRGVHFLKNAALAVRTAPEPTVSAFVRQRLRWATKNAALPHGPTRLVAAVAWLFCWLLLVLPVVSVWSSGFRLPAALAWMVKMAADFSLLYTGCRFFGQTRLLRAFFPAQLLHVLYIAGVGTAGLFVRRYWWKGRKVR